MAFSNRGDEWIGKGDNDRAIADYSEAIRLDPSIEVQRPAWLGSFLQTAEVHQEEAWSRLARAAAS